VAIIGVMVTGYGLKMTWNKNGKSHARDYGAVVQGQKDMNATLERLDTASIMSRDDMNKKLDAVLATQQKQDTHCAKMSTGIDIRVKQLEKENEYSQHRR